MKQTYRFCRVCMQVRLFQLNKNIRHSECMVCNSRFAFKKMKDIQRIVERHFNEKMYGLKAWRSQVYADVKKKMKLKEEKTNVKG